MFFYGNRAPVPLTSFTVTLSPSSSLAFQLKPMKNVLEAGEQVFFFLSYFIYFFLFFIFFYSFNFVLGTTIAEFCCFARVCPPS